MHFLLYSSFLRDVKEKGFLFLVPRSSFFVKTKNQELLNNPSQAVPLDKDLALPEHVKRVDVVGEHYPFVNDKTGSKPETLCLAKLPARRGTGSPGIYFSNLFLAR